MAFTTKSKVLGASVIGVIVVVGLAYGQYTNTKEIAKLASQPAPTAIVKIVTPTLEPTATPAALLKFTPVKTVTKGITK